MEFEKKDCYKPDQYGPYENFKLIIFKIKYPHIFMDLDDGPKRPYAHNNKHESLPPITLQGSSN